MVTERRKARIPMDPSGNAWWRGTLEEAAGELWDTLGGREDRQSQSPSAVPGTVRNLAGWVDVIGWKAGDTRKSGMAGRGSGTRTWLE